MDAVRSTLVGLATGTPDGGVAIVRLSGPSARTHARALVRSLPVQRRLVRRDIDLGASGIEEALVVWMPGPNSFTGEDVVELHVHAGARNVRAVIERCLELGAVAAGPGDFSRRAFELGRLTLEQAEGIAAIVGAQTEAALAQARRLAAGELGSAVERVRVAVEDLRTEVEANLDFPEDVDAEDVTRWRESIQAIEREIAVWLARFEAGRRARERARVVLAGPPNAGKSSLFNALLGQARAIVAPTAGTTRDYVEAELELGPHVCVLVDTAGLRSTAEAIEAEGIARSQAQAEGADVVLWLEAADAEDDAEGMPPTSAEVIRVETKRDRGCRRPMWLGVAVTPGGIDGVEELRARLLGWFGEGNGAWIGLARHRDRASESAEALRRALALDADVGLELLAFELGIAERRLGEITGRTALGPVGEDVLDRIFSRFCIGK